MSKIRGLYQNYKKEQTEDFRDFCTGGEDLNEFMEFLKNKLDAEDFLTAEEMLNNLIAQVEEKGFTAGAKYTAELGKELLSK